MKLTKDQRHTAYVLMLAELEEKESKDYYPYMCWVLKYVFDMPMYGMFSLVELYNKKPESVGVCDEWFPSWDYKSRKKLLKQCIEETYNF
jgi:hypothetical protein